MKSFANRAKEFGPCGLVANEGFSDLLQTPHYLGIYFLPYLLRGRGT